MGTKRTIDTGKRDSLGRPIKISEHQNDYNSTGEHGTHLNDFEQENMNRFDAVNILSSLADKPSRVDSLKYSKLLDSSWFINEKRNTYVPKYKTMWDDSISTIYNEAESLDLTDLSFKEANELMKKHLSEEIGFLHIESPVPAARKLYGISEDETRLLKINKRLYEDNVKNPRKKRMNKALMGKAQQLLDDNGDEQAQAIYFSIANNDDKLEIYPLGGDMYKINYNPEVKKENNSDELYSNCYAYIPEDLENLENAVFSDPFTYRRWYESDDRDKVPKSDIFRDLSAHDKIEFLKNSSSTSALSSMFSIREKEDKKNIDNIYDSTVSIDYVGLRKEKTNDAWEVMLTYNDYKELVYYNKFQENCDTMRNDIRNNYDSDIEAFQAAKHGVVLTGEKSNKKSSNHNKYNASKEVNNKRKKAVIQESNETMNVLSKSIQDGMLSNNVIDIIHRYSHSAYHSYYEDSMFEGSINKSYITRKKWNHADTIGFDNAIKHLEDNTPRNQRTLYRLAEVPNTHTVDSYVKSLSTGDVVKTLRASSSTMIGQSAINTLLGDERSKVVYRYDTKRGVAIANSGLSEVVDEGEVIIPKDSEFVVTGSYFDEDFLL